MVGLPVQAIALNRMYPEGAVSLSHNALVWRGSLTPSQLSATYTVQLVADNRGTMPEARVLAPQLSPDAHGRLPHIWPNGSLCLNRKNRWSRRFIFAHTIVPWTSEWLLHYELWKGSGVWYGDGTEAEIPESQASLLHDYIYDARG